jgi:hypothetical protein
VFLVIKEVGAWDKVLLSILVDPADQREACTMDLALIGLGFANLLI